MLERENTDSQKNKVLYVYTHSDRKIEEIGEILGIKVKKILPNYSTGEVQSINIETVIKQKAKDAYFQNKGKPTLVEHTGLYINYLSGFPGAMTDSFINSTLTHFIALNNRGLYRIAVLCGDPSVA